MKKIGLLLATSVLIETMGFTAFAGQWESFGPTWSYIKDDGAHASSEWITDSGKWYHFDANGVLETGWILDNGKWYFLGSGGEMSVNRFLPDGLYLGADGVWIPGYAAPESDKSDDSDDSENQVASGDKEENDSSGTNNNTETNTSDKHGSDGLKEYVTQGPKA